MDHLTIQKTIKDNQKKMLELFLMNIRLAKNEIPSILEIYLLRSKDLPYNYTDLFDSYVLRFENNALAVKWEKDYIPRKKLKKETNIKSTFDANGDMLIQLHKADTLSIFKNLKEKEIYRKVMCFTDENLLNLQNSLNLLQEFFFDLNMPKCDLLRIDTLENFSNYSVFKLKIPKA